MMESVIMQLVWQIVADTAEISSHGQLLDSVEYMFVDNLSM